ncbi:MAG: hypothetical protein ABI912_07760 [Actinomycetota bacterium]
MIPSSASFLNAYLVAGDSESAPLGVVRRDPHVWRIFLFGVAAVDQPTQVFATRDPAGARLVELTRKS